MQMAKTTINVSVSDSLKELARQQVEKKHFSTMSDYIQHLIRTDVDRQKAQEQFDAYIKAGIDSGISELSAAEIFAKAKKRIDEIASDNKKK